MLKMTRILCLVSCCLLALSFSTDSFARPNDCIDECTFQCPCSLVCFYYGLTTCGAFTSGACSSSLAAKADSSPWLATNAWQLSTPPPQPTEQLKEPGSETEAK